MALVMRLSICLLVLISIFGLGSSERTSKKIYIPLTHVQGCFRRLNATHQIGCGSKMGGNIGVIHNIETDADLEWIIEYGPNAPYIPVMTSINFNVTNVKRLKDSGKVSGILVSHILSNTSISPLPPDGFSPAHSCPLDAFGRYRENSEYGHCQKVQWNPVGSSLMYEDLGIPIFVILNKTELNWLIYDCYEKFNKPGVDGKARAYPLCSAELKSAMYAAKDSVTCIRRTKHMVNLNVDQYCEPLGDQNVYATVKQTSNKDKQPNASVILVAARIDSFTLFDQTTPSADNDITGFIALLAAAQALTESGMRDKIQNNTKAKDIMFTFFQGEAFDYIGSSRMVYEMEKNRFPGIVTDGNIHLHPINLTHISHLLEVNQLGFGAKQVWLHSDPISRNTSVIIDNEVQKMVKFLKKIGTEHTINVAQPNISQPLPPASVQRFLMKQSLPTIVMTDHQKEFTNQYYQSRFDISNNIKASYPSLLNRSDWYDHVTPQAEQLAHRAGVLAQFLYFLSTGEDNFIPVNKTLVTHLLYCFLYNGTCDLFKTVLDKKDSDKLTGHPYTFYVSVARNTNHVSVLIKKLLAYFLGDKVNVSNSASCKGPDNDKLHSYIWMQGPADENSSRPGVCIKSTAAFSEAKSPVFLDEMDGYDWASGEYSSWTESTWNTFSVRLFLVPSKQFQTATLSSGVVLLLVSLLLVYFLNSNALIIFSPNGPNFY